MQDIFVIWTIRRNIYNTNEVQQLGGAVYEDIIGNSYDRKRCISEMINYVDRQHIYSYSQLLRFARWHNSDWFNCLLESSYILKEYIAGCRLEYDYMSRNGCLPPGSDVMSGSDLR